MSKKETILKILKLKENIKREVEIEVKKANDRVDEEETRLRLLENDYRENLELFSDAASMEVKNINTFYSFFERINQSIDRQKDVCSEKKTELEEVKGTLIDAHKDEKMFEILHDKAVIKEKKAMEKAEQNEADFFAVSRRTR